LRLRRRPSRIDLRPETGHPHPKREHPMSDSTPETGTDTTTDTETGTETEQVDWKAEAQKWQALSRKNEERAKANADAAKELEQLRRESMNERERAVEEARSKAEAEVTARFAAKLVDAEVRAAAAGRDIDIDALLEGLDRSRFITDDGDADQEAIAKWVDRVAPAPDVEEQPRGRLDLGQGTRTPPHALNGDPLLRDLKSKLGIR